MALTTIEAGKAERHYWADVWRCRELLFIFSWRDIIVRYKQTVLGISWAILRPLVTTWIFVFVFHRLAKLPEENVPYPVFVLSAMIPWQLFSSVVTEAGNSLVTNANMVSKIYFPRILIPVSCGIAALVDFFVSCVILVALMTFYRIEPTWKWIFLIPFTALAGLASLGFGFWLSALTVEYRDFRYLVPFLLQVGTYISPVGYADSLVPEKFRFVYALNPMVGIINGFRWAIFPQAPLNSEYLTISILMISLFMLSGVLYFRRTEKTFADVI